MFCINGYLQKLNAAKYAADNYNQNFIFSEKSYISSTYMKEEYNYQFKFV